MNPLRIVPCSNYYNNRTQLLSAIAAMIEPITAINANHFSNRCHRIP
jgi:hypothetical protein